MPQDTLLTRVQATANGCDALLRGSTLTAEQRDRVTRLRAALNAIRGSAYKLRDVEIPTGTGAAG